jgi:mannose-6-phosphate isomerase-like protein (cupin superfamily)
MSKGVSVKEVDLGEAVARLDAYWSPRIVSRYNENDVMVVKVKGAFDPHIHPDTDDFFLVLTGRLLIETDQGNVSLGPGQLYIVPKGVRHRPVAEEETHLLLIEPTGTPNTGDEATAAVKSWDEETDGAT